MTRVSKFAILITTVLALGGVPELASAQCDPDATFCADARGPLGQRATVQVRTRARTVVVQPAPPPPQHVVVVQPEPPPPQRVIVVQQPPPPPQQRVIVVQPAPPPPQRVIVLQPAPPPPQQYVVVQPQPQPQPQYQQQVRVVQPRPRWTMDDANRRRVGFHAEVGGTVGRNVRMGGFAAGLRLRPVPFLGIDVTGGIYAGTDYVGNDRVEVPVRLDFRFFLNPQSRAQVYGLVGAGVSVSRSEGFDDLTGRFTTRDYTHVGGEIGAGIEFRLNRVLALNVDVRGFLRQRVDSNPQPEFAELDATTGEVLRTTDTSAGALINVGGTLYFGGR